VTERTDPRGFDNEVEADLADTGANRAPAEGGREEVADLPGADTLAGDEPAEEDDQDP
jgi:hypothetical protein